MAPTRQPYQEVTFPSRDKLTITADLYTATRPRGFMLLCHRSHFHRGEYRTIAPRLVELGFSCLAIDQRSGMNVLGEHNKTSSRAKEQGLPTGYLDARPDIEAAIDYAYGKNHRQPIILFGSSYSAALALLIAPHHKKIKAVVACSPGEYLKKINLAETLRELDKPTYITSTKEETAVVTKLIRLASRGFITHNKPHYSESAHGARALWPSTKNNEQQWQPLIDFLQKY